MRLKSVYISQYKNLKDFTLNFDGNSFIDVFVGKNGTGKSNLFEALIEIFRNLYEYKKKADLFNFRIKYEIDDKDIEIAWTSGQLKINGVESKTIAKDLLPDNILIYYSGHNRTVAGLVEKYEKAFRDRLRRANHNDSRRFIGIGPEYKALLLSVLLMQNDDNKARQFICQKLDIKTVGTEVTLVLKRPAFVDKKLKIEPLDPKTIFWGIEGITRQFLDKLVECVKGEFNLDYLYNPEIDHYSLLINIKLFQNKFEEETSNIFRQFDNLKTLNILEEISISLTLENGKEAAIDHFSDGQFQSVYIYSIIELFKDRNCITLLDEPDSFLHPEWQFEFLRQVFEITDTTAKNNNHVLMSSHSAVTLTVLPQPKLNVFEILENTVKVSSINKEEVIKLLSGNRIFLTENESIMSISTYLKNSSQPVLFTEGISDEYILEFAWKSLFPGHSRPFCIHNAFDRNFLRNLFSRNEIRDNFPERIMFALFDFDDAYDDWNGLKGRNVVTDPFKGLTKKLSHQTHYAMLLPVPEEDEIKKQVLNTDDKPWGRGSDSHLPIELLFYKKELIGHWFEKRDISCGGKLIVFNGDKVKFAKEYVSTLNQSSFEVFRPMFDFIQLRCKSIT